MDAVLRGCLIPIINTIFIELSITAYLITLFLVLSQDSTSCDTSQRATEIEASPLSVSEVNEDQTSPSNSHSSAHCSNGSAPVFKYLNTR
jgi:hypothetical protein